MSRIATAFLACLLAMLAAAQTPAPIQSKEPPQTARQALIEAFFGTSPNHLERHLSDVTQKAFRKLDTGGSNRNFITEISNLGMELKAGSGGSLQTMDTGPVLLSVEQAPMRQKLEIVVERDDLVGEENQIELSFHMYKGGQEQRWPVIPRLTVSLKPEANVWRIYDLNLSVRAPIGDPEFLKTLVDTLLEQQQSSNEMMAAMALRSIATAEASAKSGSSAGPYICSLPKLADDAKSKQNQYPQIDEELASGKKNGYIFALTGCDALHFKAVAEPATPAAGKKAFCTDESGSIKFAADGKATTCLRAGQEFMGPSGQTATGIGEVIP